MSNIQQRAFTLDEMSNEIRNIFELVDGFNLFETGFIAGGFGYHVANYLYTQDKTSILEKARRWWPGSRGYKNRIYEDVDFFISPSQNLPTFLTRDGWHEDLTVDVQTSTFAKNIIAEYPKNVVNKIQVITGPAFRYSSPVEAFANFDFTVCQFAITKCDDGTYTLWHTSEALNDMRQQKLSISHTDSPFLGKRIIKYLSKNFILPKEESSKISDWLMRVVSNSWPHHFEKFHQANAESHVKKLWNKGLLSVSDLGLFLNKWQVTEYSYDGTRRTTDWAVQQIQQHRKEKT